jgi:hypothetical protein
MPTDATADAVPARHPQADNVLVVLDMSQCQMSDVLGFMVI